MRKILTYSTILILSALFACPSFAQIQKLGHLNSFDLLTALPDYKMAEQKLETYAVQLRKKLTEEELQLQEEYEAYRLQLDAEDLSPKEIKAKDQEFGEWTSSLQQKRLDAQKSVAKKEQELFQPIREKVSLAIQEFMKEENYAYVFDTAQGNIAIGPLGRGCNGKD